MQNKKPMFYAPKIPLDQNGFCKSFNVQKNDPKQIKQFYDDFGFVIYNDIIDEDQIKKTIDDLWKQVQQYYSYGEKKVLRSDPQSWKFIGYLNKFGFVTDGPLRQLQIWKNRSNPKVYKSFKSTYEIVRQQKMNEPLIACLDRASMLRPTTQHPEWKTKNIYHFDIDPWSWTKVKESDQPNYMGDYDQDRFQFLLGEGNYTPNNGYTKLAGVLALTDTNQKSGGFECSCGFQNYIQDWCRKYKNRINIEGDPDLVASFQKVFMKKGSLLVFSRQLPIIFILMSQANLDMPSIQG